MANAQKVRDRKFPQPDFELPVAEAVAALLAARHIEPGDQWHFHVQGDTLVITRSRAAEVVPVDGPGASPNRPAEAILEDSQNAR